MMNLKFITLPRLSLSSLLLTEQAKSVIESHHDNLLGSSHHVTRKDIPAAVVKVTIVDVHHHRILERNWRGDLEFLSMERGRERECQITI